LQSLKNSVTDRRKVTISYLPVPKKIVWKKAIGDDLAERRLNNSYGDSEDSIDPPM